MTVQTLLLKATLAAALSVGATSAVHAVVITPTTQYTAYNYGSTAAAQYAGDAGQGSVSRIYEMFVLPTFTKGTFIESAYFHIDVQSRWNSANNPLALYSVVSDTWAYTSAWVNKPALDKQIQAFNPGQGGAHFAFNVTDYINSQYVGDGKASLAIAAKQEGQGKNSWTYFTPNSGNLTFTLGKTAVVPEPGTIALFALALAGVFTLRRRARK